MDNQELRDQYTFYMKQLVSETLDLDSLITTIEDRRDMIAPYLMSDPFYPLDYGYSINDFYNSFHQPLGGHVDYGLFPYLQTRVDAINDQLENTTMKPVIKYISHNRGSSSEVWVKAFIDVNNIPPDVSIKYTIEGEAENEASMYDDGQHNDGEAGDQIYGGLIDNIPENSSLTYQVSVIDNSEKENTLPCEPVLVPPAGGNYIVLYINEFMASNDTTIADEHGDYDDWIEVYNPESETIWLGDNYLTDNLSKPDKWQMPDAYIEPGEFLIFWADGEPEQGPFHTSFKLSKDGEEIGIFNSELATIDEYIFGQQETDISKGRLPNGGPEWVFFEKPTPGASNEASAIPETANANLIFVYPNPVKGAVVNLSEACNFTIYNLMGQPVVQQKNSHLINISRYNKGIYFVVIDNGQTLKLIIQ